MGEAENQNGKLFVLGIHAKNIKQLKPVLWALTEYELFARHTPAQDRMAKGRVNSSLLGTQTYRINFNTVG